MADGYRIIGAEMSPYWSRYAPIFATKPSRTNGFCAMRQPGGIRETRQNADHPSGGDARNGIQDPRRSSTNRKALSGALDPSRDPVARFISALIEEFGDEWGNKWMFHYRWARDVDQICSAGRIARNAQPESRAKNEHDAIPRQMRARMVDRVWFVGSNAADRAAVEAGFHEMLGIARQASFDRPYLFGGRPAFGDFGLWGQFYEMWTDPTAGALIGGGAPHVLDWVHRMLWPKAEGAFETGRRWRQR